MRRPAERPSLCGCAAASVGQVFPATVADRVRLATFRF